MITREPSEPYQREAMDILAGCPWLEIRYNPSVHAKVYVALSSREADSFALFGSGNLTARSFESNIEVGMMLYGDGIGRPLLRDLHYWAVCRLRTLRESRLVQRIRAQRR